MKTFASLFTGFGGADIGAMAAGYTPAWGIEYRADIAEVANANLGGHVRVADVLACDPRDFERVDLLHASPPCPNFSVANAGRGETAHDIDLARKVAKFVTVLRPDAFTLENVIAYQNSQSWRLIEAALWQAGYWVNVERVNAANYGVPQTRRRMIARAVRGGWVPGLPPPVPWVGWYVAIKDILDTLPDSKFAPRQLARLPEMIGSSFYTVAQQSDDHKGSEFGYGCPRREEDDPAFSVTTQTPSWFKAFILSNAKTEYSDGIRAGDEPMLSVTPQQVGRAKAFLLTGQYGQPNDVADRAVQGVIAGDPSPTVTGSQKGDWRAFLVDQLNSTRLPTIRSSDQPSFVSTASYSRRPANAPRAWLDTGRVVAMTPRALARFQSFPDWYELPAERSLAALGIGNAVPPLLYQRIAEAFKE